MSDEKKRKSGGAKLARTETVTVRLDEKLRYLAELAARKQRRTLSSFVEWAVQDSLERVTLQPATSSEAAKTVASEATCLWDVDEPARFVKLATAYPELLTYDEQLQLNLLRKALIWDHPDYDPNASDPETLDAPSLANKTTERHRIAMVRLFWKSIRQMSQDGLLRDGLFQGATPASAIADAARQAYKETSETADQLRLLHKAVDIEGGEDI